MNDFEELMDMAEIADIMTAAELRIFDLLDLLGLPFHRVSDHLDSIYIRAPRSALRCTT